MREALKLSEFTQPVQEFIEHEFLRSCAIVYESQPKVTNREGWGTPSEDCSTLLVGGPLTAQAETRHEGIRFRTALLDTIADIGARFIVDQLVRHIFYSHRVFRCRCSSCHPEHASPPPECPHGTPSMVYQESDFRGREWRYVLIYLFVCHTTCTLRNEGAHSVRI